MLKIMRRDHLLPPLPASYPPAGYSPPLFVPFLQVSALVARLYISCTALANAKVPHVGRSQSSSKFILCISKDHSFRRTQTWIDKCIGGDNWTKYLVSGGSQKIHKEQFNAYIVKFFLLLKK